MEPQRVVDLIGLSGGDVLVDPVDRPVVCGS